MVMTDTMTPLSIEERFRFSCSEQVPCFNECCRDLNQFLTPYDVLRLKKRLQLPSSVFLQRYTTQHNGPESGLPVTTFKMKAESGFKCPFVTPEGCSVYEDRPSSCRMYPLARAISRSRETGEIKEYFMLIREPHCHGFNQDHTQTVREWIENQGLAAYNRMNDELMEIISLKNRMIPGPLDRYSRDIFHMACYDLDTFREKIFNEGLLAKCNLSQSIFDAIQHDDITLLRVGLAWIKNKLFGLKMPPDEILISTIDS